MVISEMIAALEALKTEHGDLPLEVLDGHGCSCDEIRFAKGTGSSDLLCDKEIILIEGVCPIYSKEQQDNK